MMGQMLWNSLSSAFQIDIMPHKQEFQRNQEYDGPLLWDYIRRRVKPSTTVGASKLKDEIERKTMMSRSTTLGSWTQEPKSCESKEKAIARAYALYFAPT